MTSRQTRRTTARQIRRRWYFVLACAVVCVVAVSLQRSQVRIPAVPMIDTTSCSPAVAAAIGRACDEVRQSPRSADAWGHLAMFLVAHQFESEATGCFRQAMRLDPNEFRWPYLLGVTLLVTDREAAVEQFQRAVEVRGDVVLARNRLAELLTDLGRYDEARLHFASAQRLEPRELRANLGIARLEYLCGNLPEALKWAERAVALAPQQRAVHELLALIHQRAGHRDKADQELEIVAALPDQPLIWNDPVAAQVVAMRQDAAWSLEQAESLLARQQVAEAVQLLDHAWRRDQSNPRVACALARTLIQVDQVERAVAVLANAEAAHPRNAEVHFQRGVAYFLEDHPEDARRAFERAIALKPDYALAHYNLGHTLERLGDSDAALMAFEFAARSRPTHSGAHVNAARLLLEQGNTPAATEHLELALQLAPGDNLAQELLIKAREATAAPTADASNQKQEPL